jgi:hypothetical protein
MQTAATRLNKNQMMKKKNKFGPWIRIQENRFLSNVLAMGAHA